MSYGMYADKNKVINQNNWFWKVIMKSSYLKLQNLPSVPIY